jgi:hypothetical protein
MTVTRGIQNYLELKILDFNNSGSFNFEFCNGTQYTATVESVCGDCVLFVFTTDCEIEIGYQDVIVNRDSAPIHTERVYVQ